MSGMEKDLSDSNGIKIVGNAYTFYFHTEINLISLPEMGLVVKSLEFDSLFRL